MPSCFPSPTPSQQCESIDTHAGRRDSHVSPNELISRRVPPFYSARNGTPHYPMVPEAVPLVSNLLGPRTTRDYAAESESIYIQPCDLSLYTSPLRSSWPPPCKPPVQIQTWQMMQYRQTPETTTGRPITVPPVATNTHDTSSLPSQKRVVFGFTHTESPAHVYPTQVPSFLLHRHNERVHCIEVRAKPLLLMAPKRGANAATPIKRRCDCNASNNISLHQHHLGQKSHVSFSSRRVPSESKGRAQRGPQRMEVTIADPVDTEQGLPKHATSYPGSPYSST